MATAQDIGSAASEIRQGGLVAFPTETVYGLGANALDANAVAQIFEMKGRPHFDPLIVHIADVGQLDALVKDVPPLAKPLIEQFWPGPLSLVLEKQDCVPEIVTAGLSSVAIRFPAHEMAQALIRAAGAPLAAPSANRFGRVSPTRADHVSQQFGDQLTVLDGGPCRVGLESTVVSFVEIDPGQPVVLRPGGITMEQIEAVIGPLKSRTKEDSRPSSPGQLSSHYSPATPLVLAEEGFSPAGENRVGLLSYQRPLQSERFSAVEVLSEQGCPREAAVKLFAALHRLDALNLDQIVAWPVPEAGLGRAIMDRLRRAAAK